MHAKHALVISTLLTLVFAGCTGSSAPAETKPGPTVPTGATQGTDEMGGAIQGTVVDDEAQPVEGVKIGVIDLELEVKTDAAGSFLFEKVPAGKYKVAASHIAYEQAGLRSVEVIAGETAQLRFTLTPMPVVEPRNETAAPFEGRVSCGLASTSPCAAAPLVGLAGLDDPTGNRQGANWSYEGDLPDEVVIEVVWTASMPAAGAKLTYSFATFSEDGLDRHEMAGGDDASPIYVKVAKEQLEAALDEYKDDFQFILYPDSDGATVMQDFTLYRTDFYNMSAPEGFTAAPVA